MKFNAKDILFWSPMFIITSAKITIFFQIFIILALVLYYVVGIRDVN